jgi:hypothetical protein
MKTRTERFWENIRKHKNESGHFYTTTKSKLSSHSEMNEMQKYNIIYDIDPQIREFVIALNKKGYRTEGSCAGHKRGERGFVTIKGNFEKLNRDNQIKIVNLAKNYGLKNLRLYSFIKTMYYRITFDPVGIVTKGIMRKNRELEN